MNCGSCGELMVDVLYGEEISTRQVFEFHKHLSKCSSCNNEYLELLETRELLGAWEDPAADTNLNKARITQKKPGLSKVVWFPLIQKAAAGILMVLGLFALLQFIGIIPEENSEALVVSDEQLAQMIHDVVVEKRVEDWKLIGSALLRLKEEIKTENRVGIQNVQQDMDELRYRYVMALEDYSRRVENPVNQ
jgi:hypothetical protein